MSPTTSAFDALTSRPHLQLTMCTAGVAALMAFAHWFRCLKTYTENSGPRFFRKGRDNNTGLQIGTKTLMIHSVSDFSSDWIARVHMHAIFLCRQHQVLQLSSLCLGRVLAPWGLLSFRILPLAFRTGCRGWSNEPPILRYTLSPRLVTAKSQIAFKQHIGIQNLKKKQTKNYQTV